jgi:di/tricarboxylate transporter
MNDSNNRRSEERRNRREEARERWRAKFEARFQDMESGEYHRRGRMWTGIFILLIGVAVLIDRTSTGLPEWLISWQTFLIALGLFIGVKHQFRNVAWLVLILVGGAFCCPR